jgi:hypothetical protein
VGYKDNDNVFKYLSSVQKQFSAILKDNVNDVVGYWAYIRRAYIWGTYIRVGLYLGGGGGL